MTRLIDGGELDVAVAFGTSRLRIGRQSDAHDFTLVLELLADRILVGAEGDVANEQGVALGAGLVTKGFGPSLSLLLGITVVGVTGFSKVQVDLATINLGILLALVGLFGIGSVGELDIAETGTKLACITKYKSHSIEQIVHSPSRATRITLSHDTHTGKFAKLFELAAQPLFIDIPREIADKEVGRVFSAFSLGLLRSRGLLFLSFALLRCFLGHLFGLLFFGFILGLGLGLGFRLRLRLRARLGLRGFRGRLGGYGGRLVR
ncbi:hypothetical protein T310_8982 [Rasamsonia emersonii CBS 393.64]|uniref:Uncharacterized protein n=1 Tax=Rasamsonia emersonii (strain ATCC 16479 / CBS 393.64 / IMI 116815) TaxID=1408163 RepID=A0A0F4YH98_RASE3|nr:hypothetical protein T310_8982 [Rasamsonia emersonii CBS 393.64]KKA17256.1 hypothetical protein T310_8982 [Rasamsonia emersonii CBS 393.64]